MALRECVFERWPPDTWRPLVVTFRLLGVIGAMPQVTYIPLYSWEQFMPNYNFKVLNKEVVVPLNNHVVELGRTNRNLGRNDNIMTGGEKDFKMRLSGAGRKRLRILLEKGCDVDEARRLAHVPFSAVSYRAAPPYSRNNADRPTGNKMTYQPIEKTAGRTRLCGAARKRLRYLLHKGYNIEKAKVMAQRPMKDSQGALQKYSSYPRGRYAEQRSERTQSPNNIVKLPTSRNTEPRLEKYQPYPNRIKNTTFNNTYSEGPSESYHSYTRNNNLPNDQDISFLSQQQPTLSGMSAEIVPSDFPMSFWSTEQLKLIQSCILDRIMNERKNTMKPNFLNCTFNSGWISFDCADLNTIQWLKATVPYLQPWSGAKLKVVTKVEVPEPQIYVGYFPVEKDVSNEIIFQLLKEQNNGFGVENWRLLERIHEGSEVHLTFSIDDIFVKTLRESGNIINFGFGKVHLIEKSQMVHLSNVCCNFLETVSDPENDSAEPCIPVRVCTPPPPAWPRQKSISTKPHKISQKSSWYYGDANSGMDPTKSSAKPKG